MISVGGEQWCTKWQADSLVDVTASLQTIATDNVVNISENNAAIALSRRD